MNNGSVIAQANKERRINSLFKALLTAPVVGAITLPVNAKLRLKSLSGAAAGTIAATLAGPNNRTIRTPVLAANGYITLDNVERGVVVTPSAGFEVLLHTGLGKYRKIAGGS